LPKITIFFIGKFTEKNSNREDLRMLNFRKIAIEF